MVVDCFNAPLDSMRLLSCVTNGFCFFHVWFVISSSFFRTICFTGSYLLVWLLRKSEKIEGIRNVRLVIVCFSLTVDWIASYFVNFVVSVECVNICKLWKGDGSGRYYDCSVLSCAWKAPRALTGFLASTAHPPNCPSLSYSPNGRRNRINSVSLFTCYF